MKIKEMFKEYKEAEARASIIDEAWENDYENEALEAEWIEAYKAEHEALQKLIAEVGDLTNGLIDSKTARAMIVGHRDEFEKLIDRIA